MSFDPDEILRDDAEAEFARRVLDEDALDYVVENHFRDVRDLVEDTQASEWLERSGEWLQLINIISQHDREQLRRAVRYKAAHAGQREEARQTRDVLLFDIASDIAKFLESPASGLVLPGGFPLETDSKPDEERPIQSRTSDEIVSDACYGYRPMSLPKPLVRYAQYNRIDDDLGWVAELVNVTRAFRDILFALANPGSVHTLSEPIRTIDAALERGKRDRLVYAEFTEAQGRIRFRREPDPSAAPLSTSLAEWICDYLVNYSRRIDLGACVECGKIFRRQRRDNAYCSKTCQNRVAYKRKKIFETGLLKKIEVTEKTSADRLQSEVWVYHARYGLGLIQTAKKDQYRTTATVRFPYMVRTFAWDFFRIKPHADKIEFYTATDAATLAELV